MISTPNTPPEEGAIYPTEWHLFDAIANVECRQLSDDTFELRSPTHSITVNRVGFDLYRDNTQEGRETFEKWFDEHGLTTTVRDDI